MPDAQTRREFLKWSAGGAAAVALAARPPSAHARPAASAPALTAAGANERIVMGVIGCGDRGTSLLQEFLAQPDVRIAACCDVDRRHLDSAIALTGGKADAYGDFRELLDRNDIDAVAIATPDHWHALTLVHACAASKDCYHEKPLAHTIHEGRVMVTAAQEHGRITQMGTQIHAGDNYRRVVEIVRSGVLGEIPLVRVWLCGNGYPHGRGRAADSAPPPELDYDFWLGPAPQRPYNEKRLHWNWRYYWDYGNGQLGDFGCHLIDLPLWALDFDAPRTVASTGGKYLIDDQTETPDTLEAAYEFEPPPGRKSRLALIWTHMNASGAGFFGKGMGVAFYGTNATLVADYNEYKILPEGERMAGARLPTPSIPSSPGHPREFLDSVKSRTPCSCNMPRSHKLTTIALLGNVALRAGKRIRWNAEHEHCTDGGGRPDPDANRFLSREYRKPWTLSV
jgi:predicted dehydrogenase